jgi:hypothetical protein
LVGRGRAERKAKAAAEKAASDKKTKMKELAKLLMPELDVLVAKEKGKKEDQEIQDRIAKGKAEAAAASRPFKMFETIYKYKSDDPDDLAFEAKEILRYLLPFLAPL